MVLKLNDGGVERYTFTLPLLFKKTVYYSCSCGRNLFEQIGSKCKRRRFDFWNLLEDEF